MSPARSSRRTSPHGPTGGGTGWASAKPLGGLSVAEVARRMGMRPPSLYKYFPSRTAMYDALFARGAREQQAAIGEAVTGRGPGLETLSEGFRATVRWCVEHPVLAQLLYWRPVPGFEPSSAAFAPSAEAMDELRGVLAERSPAVSWRRTPRATRRCGCSPS